LWKKKSQLTSEIDYNARRSQQFHEAISSTLRDLEEWRQRRPPVESLAAFAFINKCKRDFGSPQTAASSFDLLPLARREAVELASRTFFRLTDPMVLEAQRTRNADRAVLDARHVQSLSQVLEILIGDWKRNEEDDELIEIVGKRLANQAFLVKKISSKKFEQRGISNTVNIDILSRWLPIAKDLRKQRFQIPPLLRNDPM